MDTKKIRFDIIKSRNAWFIASLVVIAIGVASLFIQNLNYGIDFTGGQILRFKAGREVTTSEIRNIFNRFDLEFDPPQILGGGAEFIVRTASYGTAEEINRMSKDERQKKAAAFNQKITDVKIALNVEMHDIKPDKFVLYALPAKIERGKLNAVLRKAGFPPSSVTISGTDEIPGKNEDQPTTYNVSLKLSGFEGEDGLKKLATALYSGIGGARQFEQEDTIDPVFGIELKKKASIALIVATIGILLYVTIRFEFWFAVAAIIALVHDCLITVGCYSIFQLQVNSSFVAIILTVFGYSINDTIVIFDRIRENLRKDKKSPLDRLINVSLWETMPRSVNTVLTTQMAIVAILLLGGASIKDFALGLFIGITCGCFSSIFVAAPLAFIFKMSQRGGERETKSAPPAAGKQAKAVSRKAPEQPATPKAPEKQAAAKTATADAQATASKSSDDKSGGQKKGKQKGKQRRR